jgi:hypothetical protein
MYQLCHNVMHFLENMNTQEWLLLLGGAILVGAFCLRGFGSRSNY